jgi:DNA-directed RNA polymerase specialized sigma24 family protein
MEELAYDEISRLLGIPRGTVGSRLYHARAALQRVLVSEGVTLRSRRRSASGPTRSWD